MTSKVISLWRSCPALINNPILVREFWTRLRKKGSFASLLILLLFASLIFLSWWSILTKGNQPAGLPAEQMNLMIFMQLVMQAKFVAIIIIVFITASAINQETREHSWDLLRTTPINLSSIILAKLLAPVVFIWFMLFALNPFYAMLTIGGSIAPSDLVNAFINITETLLIAGLIGLYNSSRNKSAVRAISNTLVTLFLLYLVIPQLSTLVMAFRWTSFASYFRYLQYISPGFLTIYAFNPAGGLSNALTEAIIFHSCFTFLIVYFFSRGLVRNIRLNADQGDEQPKKRGNPFFSFGSKKGGDSTASLTFPDWCNPVWMKDKYEIVDRYSTKSYMELIYLVMAGIFLMACFCGLFQGKMNFNAYHYMAIIPILLTPFLILPYAANSFRSEMDANTWCLLVSSPMPDAKISWGKCQAGMYFFVRRYWALFGPWIICGIIGSRLLKDNQVSCILYTVVLSHVSAFFFLSVGMIASIIARKTISAYIISFLLIIFLLFGMPYLSLLLGFGNQINSNPVVMIASPFYLVAGSVFSQKLGNLSQYVPFQIVWMVGASMLLQLCITKIIPTRIQTGGKFS